MSQSFSITRKGYDPEEVDVYISQLQNIINQRNQELNAYHEKEAAINASVIEAKMLAGSIVEKAQKDAAEIVENGQSEASRCRAEAARELTDLTNQALAMRTKLEQFKQAYNTILQQYLVSLRAQELTALFDDLDGFLNKMGVSSEEAVNVQDLAVGSEANV